MIILSTTEEQFFSLVIYNGTQKKIKVSYLYNTGIVQELTLQSRHQSIIKKRELVQSQQEEAINVMHHKKGISFCRSKICIDGRVVSSDYANFVSRKKKQTNK